MKRPRPSPAFATPPNRDPAKKFLPLHNYHTAYERFAQPLDDNCDSYHLWSPHAGGGN